MKGVLLLSCGASIALSACLIERTFPLDQFECRGGGACSTIDAAIVPRVDATISDGIDSDGGGASEDATESGGPVDAADSGPPVGRDAASFDATNDAGNDGGTDTGVRPDATLDAGPDAGFDSGVGLDASAPDANPLDLTELNAADWGVGQHSSYAWADTGTPRCMADPFRNSVTGYSATGITVQNDTAKVAVNQSSLRVSTNGVGFTFFWFYPRNLGGAMNLSGATEVVFYFDANNQSQFGWQGVFPAVYLCSTTGAYRELRPDTNLLPVAQTTLRQISIPLAGGRSGGVTWLQADGGPAPINLSSIDWIEFAADTWEFPPTNIWIDGLHFQ